MCFAFSNICCHSNMYLLFTLSPLCYIGLDIFLLLLLLLICIVEWREWLEPNFLSPSSLTLLDSSSLPWFHTKEGEKPFSELRKREEEWMNFWTFFLPNPKSEENGKERHHCIGIACIYSFIARLLVSLSRRIHRCNASNVIEANQESSSESTFNVIFSPLSFFWFAFLFSLNSLYMFFSKDWGKNSGSVLESIFDQKAWNTFCDAINSLLADVWKIRKTFLSLVSFDFYSLLSSSLFFFIPWRKSQKSQVIQTRNPFSFVCDSTVSLIQKLFLLRWLCWLFVSLEPSNEVTR